MKLEIQIENIVAAKDHFYFIAVQMDFEDNVTPSLKFRTDIAPLSNRPKPKRNLFSFSTLVERQKLKFGLMSCENASEGSIISSKLQGVASIMLSLDKLRNLPSSGLKQLVNFMKKDKNVGQFECKIRFVGARGDQLLKQSKVGQIMRNENFNPLTSRILFTEQGSKDELRMEGSIDQLQRQMSQLYKTFLSIKSEEESLQNLYNILLKDEQQLKSEIQVTEKISEKIAIKINQREAVESMKLEIDMLSSTEEGKGILLEKLEYFEERILMESAEYKKLAEKYESIKHEIDRRIKKTEDYAHRLKGKEIQEFQIQRNNDILQRYDDIEYEFKCNQHIITSLVNKSSHSELTSEQAGLLLSQVNFELKIEAVSNSKFEKQDSLVNLIEHEAGLMNRGEEENMAEEQKIVMQIKLSALEQQISNVRNKINKIMPKNNIYESKVIRL